MVNAIRKSHEKPPKHGSKEEIDVSYRMGRLFGNKFFLTHGNYQMTNAFYLPDTYEEAD